MAKEYPNNVKEVIIRLDSTNDFMFARKQKIPEKLEKLILNNFKMREPCKMIGVAFSFNKGEFTSEKMERSLWNYYDTTREKQLTVQYNSIFISKKIYNFNDFKSSMLYLGKYLVENSHRRIVESMAKLKEMSLLRRIDSARSGNWGVVA